MVQKLWSYPFAPKGRKMTLIEGLDTKDCLKFK